jgi:hypothetical protein
MMPRVKALVARLDRAIQYAAASRFNHCCLEYWMVRRSLSSGGHSADPVADDDD